jgi:hypothetical protein
MTTTGRPEANPRTIMAFIAIIFAAQGLFAATGILPAAGTGGLLPLVLGAAFVVYASMIALVALGIWRRARWVWALAVATAVAGLILAAIRILAGEPAADHLFGMAIDAGLLYYLAKPSVRSMLRA